MAPLDPNENTPLLQRITPITNLVHSILGHIHCLVTKIR